MVPEAAVCQQGVRAVLVVGGGRSEGEHITITGTGVCTTPMVRAWSVAAVATPADANCTLKGRRWWWGAAVPAVCAHKYRYKHIDI